MQLSDSPDKLVLPFADAGAKNTIPVASQIGITAGAASLTDGFPPLTRTPIAAGGVPPSGQDMNGILYDLSAVIRWANAGGGYAYDSTFATDSNVGGYPKGARVMRSDGLGYWFNTADNNTTDPEGAGAVAAGWVPDFTTGATAVTMTSSSVTLTAAQYGKPVIIISGLLTANLNLIFPNIAGRWAVINNTTGAYSITCKTAAGTGIVVASALLIVGDATNIYAVNDGPGVLSLNAASAGGTADALTATFSPPPRSWTAITGVPFWVRAASANATTTPTFATNGLTAKTIVKGSNTALAAGDIAGAGHWVQFQYDATLDKVVQLNPATGIINASVAQIQPIATPTLAANAMTIPSVAFSLDFRNLTLGTGGVTRVSGTPSPLVIPAGATLGTINGVQSTLIDIVLNNAGTLERAIVNLAGGNDLTESGVISTTAIGVGSTANNVIYSTTARTNVPYRVVGKYVSTQATAGQWASAVSLVQGAGGEALTALSSLGYSQTWQDVKASRAPATTYYNTTSRPISVNLSMSSTTANAIYYTVNGVTGMGSSSATATVNCFTNFVVPPGGSYSATIPAGGTVTVTSWLELK